MKRSLILGAIAAVLPVAVSPPATAGTDHSNATVMWHAQQSALGRTGPVEGASASLVRNATGISFQITTHSLTPGNAYTLWLVVVDNPGACDPKPCTAPDIIGDPATDAQVRYAAGHVAGESGEGTFAGALREGPVTGWLPDRSFDNGSGAEVHLVINDHGPALAEHLPGMIRTYRGGCSDASPFPAIFPPSALNDGEPGPSICRLYQAAVFVTD
jgi:hypothetical protein